MLLAGHPRTTIVGVRVVPAFISSRGQTRRLALAAAKLLGVPFFWRDKLGPDDRGPPMPRVAFVDDQLGRGYGFETPAAMEARDLARAAGLESETTYTAKALAGLRALASEPDRRERVHLYVHTLGALQRKHEP